MNQITPFNTRLTIEIHFVGNPAQRNQQANLGGELSIAIEQNLHEKVINMGGRKHNISTFPPFYFPTGTIDSSNSAF